MSRWPAEKIELKIGGERIVLAHGNAPRELAARAGDWSAMGAELAQLLPAQARISVQVANCWARLFLFDPPVGVAGMRDCRVLLEARFEALYGPGDWLVQADWQAGRAMLACALPRSLREAFAPFSLARLAPALLDDWNRNCAFWPETGLWCAAQDGVLNLLYWEEGAMRLVRQQRGADIGTLLVLEFARLGAQLPAARYWSGTQAPPDWHQLERAA